MSKKDYSISYVRFIAAVMIIVCHMLQFYGNELHCWFDVGVQIFFCMSGYLYGRKLQPGDDEFAFYKKQFIKILTDYYVTIFLAMIVELIIIPESVSVKGMLGAVLLYSEMEGGGHLWYIPYILLCYLCTPFLVRFFSRFRKESSLFFSLAFLFAVNNIISYEFCSYFNPAWINCYVVALFLGFCEKNLQLRLEKIVKFLIAAGCLLLNPLQIYLQYVLKLQMDGSFLFYLVKTNAHAALGCTLFFVGKWLFHFVKAEGLHKFLDFTDRFTYDVYLTHHFLIIGPLSLMELTDMLPVNIFVILALILLSAGIVHFISERMIKDIQKRVCI